METGKADQKEEEEYEPMSGAAFNVTTNANRLVPITPGYGHLNTSNRHYYAGLRPMNDWYHCGRYEDLCSDKEQDSESDATSRHERRRESRKHLTTDDRRYKKLRYCRENTASSTSVNPFLFDAPSPWNLLITAQTFCYILYIGRN